MSAMAEVIDESIRNMTSNMVTKADQEKVRRSVHLSHAETHRTCSTTIPNKSTLHKSSPSCN